ncbi:MAG: serine hydrolase domain-containing protein [Pseudomonadota bacterium]
MTERDEALVVEGFVAPGFEPVRDALQGALDRGDDLGAGFCAILGGEVIVDIWGGLADREGARVWDAQTLVPIFSTTKGIAALVIAVAIDRSGGAVSYDTPVADIWPAFGAAGKDRITIGEALSHQAGLPGFPAAIDPELWLDPPALAEALAALPPQWEPGTAHGYHPLTWGYIAGELARRIDGRSLGTILREVFCAPLDIDFAIGLPDHEHGRVASIERPKALPNMGPLNAHKRTAFLTKWAAPKRGGAAWRRIEIPSANGHGTAKSVAQLYGLYANGGQWEGSALIGEATFAALTEQRTIGEDLVLPFATAFAAGVMRNNLRLYGPGTKTLAHSGWGGSMALGDPDIGLSAAYVMNRQSHHLQGDPRARRLVDTLYGCL